MSFALFLFLNDNDKETGVLFTRPSESVRVLTQQAYPDAVLAQTLPEAVALRIDGHDHMVDGLGDRVLPFQVHPRGEVHDALRQLLHVEGVQSGRTNNHLEKSDSSVRKLME